MKTKKKGGFAGACARRNSRMKMIGLALMFAVAALCMISGEVSGMISGALLAVAPMAFTLPDGVELSENEKKGLSALANHFTQQFEQFAKGAMTRDEAMNAMGEKLKSWASENGISGEKLASLEKSLKAQGDKLSALKEQTRSFHVSMGGLKSAFDQNYEGLVNAIKERKSGFSIKAVNEHTEGSIQTTGNSITSEGEEILSESVQYSNQVIFKRRGRQYIEDISSVTQVDKVPEVYVFYEEGDETGAIGIVQENAVKQQSHLSLVRNQANAKKAAGYIVVTEEMLKWRSMLWANIQQLFQNKVARDYEDKLTEDMLTNAVGYTTTPLDDTIADPNDFHAIIAAVLQAQNLNFLPDVLVINPTDQWKLALTETKNGMLILPYIQNGGQFGLLGLRVVTTTKVPAGTFIVGEGGTWYVQREQEQIRTGLVNDDLIHNRMTIVGEIFFLSYVPSNNAGSFVKAEFATVKEALKSAAA